MTIGKVYYLACVFEKINKMSSTITLILSVVVPMLLISLCCLKFDERKGKVNSHDVLTATKYTKYSVVLLVVSVALNVFVPSRSDFMIIAMTKDCKPEQIYNMTKEELKGGIDYIVKSIEEVKKYQR
ncbi:hypothetical protein [Peptoniphilus sp. HCN-40583]|uniref:hypothetical protein n=1 Tax=Peptoniphilus sp. HCN-40583 TaxID=3134662 RepID=UPI0030C6502F